jgi:hypothetical protein
MTANELRKLTREELLELLLEQQTEMDQLSMQLAEANSALQERSEWLKNMGTVAASVYRVEAICQRLEINGMKESLGQLGVRWGSPENVTPSVTQSGIGGQTHESKL